MSNILEQMLEESKRQLELEFEHKKELAQIKSCQNNEIKELKAKLAESGEQIWALENQKLHAHNCLNKLKQQLAEKEKEIEELRFKERNIFPLVESFEEKVNQDKISFAVEQLEKVKEYLVLRARKIKEINVNVVRLYSANKFIDNQIEQLTHQHEDKGE